MASTITPTQTRYNDPYQQTLFDFNTVDSKIYLSRESNKLLNVVGNDIVIKDMIMSDPVVVPNSTVQTTISSGWAIQDNTLLQITDATTTVNIDCAALSDTPVGGSHLAAFLNYEYLHTIEANLLSIDMFHIQSDGTVTDPLYRFDPTRIRILLGIIDFTKSGSNVVSAIKNESTLLLVSGTYMTIRGNKPENIVLPNLFEIAFREHREYLLKRDYLFME